MAKQKKEEAQPKRPFENDADAIVHRHLADPNHVITDEELRSIRVGVSLSAEEKAGEASTESNENRIADTKTNSEDDTLPGAQKATPWDVLNE